MDVVRGLAAMGALLLVAPNPILLIILIVGIFDTRRRWKARSTRSLEQAAYYRSVVGAGYLSAPRTSG